MIATIENTVGAQTARPLAPGRETRPIRVWLADDNAGFRELLEQLLVRSREFTCEHQFHSAEALLEGLASTCPPDVILLDVEMGGMTGVDALHPIRALAPAVRVLIVTSFFDPMYEAQAMRDGASAFLIKANAPVSLVGEIHRALASPVKMLTAPVGLGLAATGESSGNRNQPALATDQKRIVSRFITWAAQLSGHLLRPTTRVSTAESHP